MNCDFSIHEEMKNIGEICCLFCDEILQERSVKNELCCDCQKIINNNGMNVCKSCGVVQGFNIAGEYVDFHENRHKIKRKSIYHREYHINNILMDVSTKHNMTFSVEQKCKIDRVFTEIGNIIDEVNGKRKRMISINFILPKVLSMMNLPFDNFPISKLKKTLILYEKYWASIMSLIGDRIKDITQ